MEKIDEDYKLRMGTIVMEKELNIVNSLLCELKSNNQIECIYMKYDNDRPKYKPEIKIHIITHNYSDELDDKVNFTKKALFNDINDEFKYDYSFYTISIDDILNIDDNYAKTMFRIELSNFYTNILYDKHGFFSLLRDEIIKKTRPIGAIHTYECLGILDAEKKASRLLKTN